MGAHGVGQARHRAGGTWADHLPEKPVEVVDINLVIFDVTLLPVRNKPRREPLPPPVKAEDIPAPRTQRIDGFGIFFQEFVSAGKQDHRPAEHAAAGSPDAIADSGSIGGRHVIKI